MVEEIVKSPPSSFTRSRNASQSHARTGSSTLKAVHDGLWKFPAKILDLGDGVIRKLLKRNLHTWAGGVAMCVRQPFLQRTEPREYPNLRHAWSFYRKRAGMQEICVDGHGSPLGEAVDEPVRGCFKARFIKQGGMQKVRHGANAGDGMIDSASAFPPAWERLAFFPQKHHVHVDRS